MSTMNAEIYDALIAAGAPEEKARSASIALDQEIQSSKSHVRRIEKDFNTRAQKTEDNLRGDIKKIELEIKNIELDIKNIEARIHSLDKDTTVIKWMLGVVIAATVIPLVHTYL